METMEVASPTAITPSRYRFTVEQYTRIVNEVIIPEDVRVELIEGEIIAMSPIGPRHASCVTTLTWLLVRTAPPDVRVPVQNPIHLSNRSLPQPDLAIIRARDYSRALPTVVDVLVVIEVADSTRDSDRRVKFPLYAAAGIPEAWLVDLIDNDIKRYTGPGPKGYATIITRHPRETLDSTIVPGIRVPVDAVLGLGED